MMKLFVWIVAAVVIFSLFGLTKMFVKIYDWRLWTVIRRARREIREVARQRIPKAEVFTHEGANALNPGHLAFCITTATDKERDLLCEDPEIYQQFRNALLRAGYPQDTVPVVHFGIESQETVDRDYGGSWSERTQMP